MRWIIFANGQAICGSNSNIEIKKLPGMNRRQFLLTSAKALAGSWLGLPSLAYAATRNRIGNGVLPQLAIIIDDIGFSRRALHQFLDLNIPITYSVLPRLPLSERLARYINNQGHEIMLHQPMEPMQADIDPGPGALYVQDDNQSIIRIMEENIASLPNICGVNNHMGSRFTRYSAKVDPALHVIQDKTLIFVDSLTTFESQAYCTAQHLHMAALRRDVFLDAIADTKYILHQLCRLKQRAHRYGQALGIGHPYPQTAHALSQFIQLDAFSGTKLVYVSNLIGQQAAEKIIM
jgi:polysaccharide deacetylase 2 family uncharacterized protein YibQ